MQPADQTIGILVRAAFPRVVGLGEEYVHVGCQRDLLMPGKLLAVVERETHPDRTWQGAKQGADSVRDFISFLAVGASDQREPRVALDQRNQVARLVRTIDQQMIPYEAATLTAEVPWQDPATLLDARETVEFTLDPATGVWFPAISLPPQATTPATRQWFQAGHGEAVEFRVRVELVK